MPFFPSPRRACAAPRNPIVSGNHRVDTRVPVARSPNRPDLLTPHSFRLIHQGVAQGNVGLAFGLVIFAGLTTTIGSAFVYCTSYANTKALAAALGASAGVMLYVSFVEIFAIKAIEGFEAADPEHGSKLAVLCFFCGILATFGLDALVHQIGKTQQQWTGQDDEVDKVCVCHTDPNDVIDMLSGERAMWSDAAAATHDVILEADGIKVTTPKGGSGANHPFGRASEAPMPEGMNGHSKERGSDSDFENMLSNAVIDSIDTPSKKHLKRMGFLTACAIALHNFPEGLATFVAALADAKLGVALAVAIAVHNIPEGICVAMPVYYATGSKFKGFMWSFVSGISEPIGGLFGYLILYSNGMSDMAYGALFSCVGGMMVYISLKELLPTALKYDQHDHYVTNCMFGGMAIMALSLILFQI